MIYNFNLIAPKTDSRKPFLNRDGFFVIPTGSIRYKYYIEVSRYHPVYQTEEYYVLLSDTKFDEQCRKGRVDGIGRFCFRPHGDMLAGIEHSMEVLGNVEVEYIESTDEYDLWQVKI